MHQKVETSQLKIYVTASTVNNSKVLNFVNDSKIIEIRTELCLATNNTKKFTITVRNTVTHRTQNQVFQIKAIGADEFGSEPQGCYHVRCIKFFGIKENTPECESLATQLKEYRADASLTLLHKSEPD